MILGELLHTKRNRGKSTCCRPWHTAGASLLLLLNDGRASSRRSVDRAGQDSCPPTTHKPPATRLPAWVAASTSEGSRLPGFQHLTDACCPGQDKSPRLHPNHSSQESGHKRMRALWRGAGPEGGTVCPRGHLGTGAGRQRRHPDGEGASWRPGHHIYTNWGRTGSPQSPLIYVRKKTTGKGRQGGGFRD